MRSAAGQLNFAAATLNPQRKPMNQHLVLPVIHVTSGSSDPEATAHRNANLAFEEGADGVFIIGHGYTGDLIALANEIKAVGSERWVGVNCLNLDTHEVIERAAGLDAVWTDNAEIDETGTNHWYPHYVWLLKNFLYWNERKCDECGNVSKTKMAYFGGLAFKYQRKIVNLEAAAREASKYMDFICTSGDGTGHAPEVHKIKELAKGASVPIAIASGITPENVTKYLPYAKAFLVATGISSDFDNLNRELVAALIREVRAYKPAK